MYRLSIAGAPAWTSWQVHGAIADIPQLLIPAQVIISKKAAGVG
jgi:hypothetical protein